MSGQVGAGVKNVGIGIAYLCLWIASLQPKKIAKKMEWGFYLCAPLQFLTLH